MSYITKFLKQAGVNTSYQDDRTKAQIEEANKTNPLAGYGFLTAAQKQQRQLAMQLYEQQQRREQEQMQQQLLARMSSQEKIGYYAGSGLMGLMGKLKGSGQAPEVPNVAEDDPEIQRYNQLAQEVGPETAMEILGQETGNASMIQQAANMRRTIQKEDLEMQNLQSQIDSRSKEAKPNNVITVQRTGPKGVPMQVSMEIVGRGPDGRNIYRELGEAVKGSLSADNAEAFDTTKSGVDTRTKNMENMLTSTANALDSYDMLEQLVQETPAMGWAGALTSKAEDVISGVQNLSTLLADEGKANGWNVTATKDINDYDFSSLEKFAGANAKIKALVLELAYARAAATGDSSRSLSDRDVQNQLDQIGGSISNPKIFLDLVKQNRQQMVKKLENFGRYTMVDGKPIGDAPQYKSVIREFKNRVGMKSTGTVTMYRNGRKYNIPEDQVDAFIAAGGSMNGGS